MVLKEPMYRSSRMTLTPRRALAKRAKRMTRRWLLFISPASKNASVMNSIRVSKKDKPAITSDEKV